MRQLLFAIFAVFILVPLLWRIEMSSIATVLFLGVTILPVVHFLKCCFYRRNKKHRDRSLSFGFKSIRRQINEFKFIDRFESMPKGFRVFCKKLSVSNDQLFFEPKRPHKDYFGDPAYSSSILNMYNNHKMFY